MKKTRKFSRNTAILLITLLTLAVGASAVLLEYYGIISKEVTVNKALSLSGTGCADDVCTETASEIAGGETITSETYTLTSQTSVNAPIDITTTISPVEEGITSVVEYQLHAEGTSPRESRVRVEEPTIVTLSDLNTASFDQYVTEGYLGHLDVLIDTDGDGVSDDALVFEYAKVDPNNCDNAPYPTGEINTFGDKGTISDTSSAWLSSGDAGPCGGGTFYYHTLAEWKAGQTENGKTIDGNTPVIALEFEADSWISTTTLEMRNLKVNGLDVSPTVQTLLTLIFDVETTFGLGNSGIYTLTTTVVPN